MQTDYQQRHFSIAHDQARILPLLRVAAHAGAYPELGVNAADAMTLAQVAIGLLRQQTSSTDRIQGIVTEAGSAANIIPGTSHGRWIVHADTLGALAPLTARVQRCFEAGALATGCELSTAPAGPDYADMRPDPGLLALYVANAETLGRVFPQLPAGIVGAATDMGNVSHVVPTIHPMLGLDCAPAVNHQPKFTAACITPAADRAVLDGAIAMAWTAADLAAAAAGGNRT
jgi:metal-dependent amidase/aminoacylase/carboxypeptidase family protein